MDLLADDYKFTSLKKFNIIFGKNGSGKSTLLRKISYTYIDKKNEYFVQYISPERGGTIGYNASIDQQISGTSDGEWFNQQNNNNQFPSFREASFSTYSNLENIVLREIESQKERRDDHSYTFDKYIEKINNLLDNVQIERANHDGFKIV